jgi:hypothetical protein
MRNNVFGAIAVAAAVLVSGSAFAGDHGPSLQERQQNEGVVSHDVSFGYSSNANYTAPSTFNIVYLGELTKGQRGHIKAAATSEAREAVRASIDASTAAELRSHGVQINNIVASAKAFNGATVFYVR